MIILVPTRGRPQNIVELRKAIDDTAATKPRLVLAVDMDDSTLQEYGELGEEMVIGPRQRLGPWLNTLAQRYAHDDGVLGFLGDDHRPRTEGWDAQIELAMTHSPRIVYGNDLIQGPMLPTAAFLSSQIVHALGWMVPPGLVHMYIDNSWKVLGEQARILRYLDHVIIEHCHPLANKGVQWDEGYSSVNNNEVMSADKETFEQWIRSGGLSDAVAKIGAI